MIIKIIILHSFIHSSESNRSSIIIIILFRIDGKKTQSSRNVGKSILLVDSEREREREIATLFYSINIYQALVIVLTVSPNWLTTFTSAPLDISNSQASIWPPGSDYNQRINRGN